MLVIEHITVYTPDERIENTTVRLDAGRIVAVGTGDSSPPALGEQRLDGRGLHLAPGFIDLQLNGAFGDDFTAHPETIWKIAAQLPRYGVTSFLPTIITSPPAQVRAAQRVLLDERPTAFRGAEPLGLHLEGPFLNPRKTGAHNPAYLCAPGLRTIDGWSPERGVRLVTLAPELPGALELIQELTRRDIVVSAGHSMATVDEAHAGWDHGIRYATHLFNAMPPLDHRAPGLGGAVLANPEWVAGLIPDGIHVHPTLIQATWLAKGRHHLSLVSDAMGALGMTPGRYHLNDFDVVVTDRDARLQDGTLAGSILPLDQAVRNLITFTGCTLQDALATVTTTPARLLGLAHARGRIAPGYVADLVLLDEQRNVTATIAAGEIVYSASV
jgi:N-acetylglucosamine-6-phosphate deacetylase